jgi:hypothetical protein
MKISMKDKNKWIDDLTLEVPDIGNDIRSIKIPENLELMSLRKEGIALQ